MKTVVNPGVLLLIGVPAALRISLAFMAQTQLWAAPRGEPAQTAEGDLYHVLFLVLALFGAVGATLAVRRARRREDELRKSASALEESRRKYQVVADNTYDWEYWLDPAGRFQYTSPSCQRITGYAPAEFEADPDLLGRILHPEDQPRVASHWSSIEAGPRECELEFRIVRRDGEVRWISHRCRPVRDERGNWLGQRASNSDITSLRSAESQAGQRSNVLLSALLENLRTAVVAVDDRCRIVLVNRAFREMFGSASSDLLMGTGCLLADGYCRLHPGAAVGAEELQLADGRILQRDYVPLSAEGSYAGHLCMFLDVTSQKRAMQAIEERQSVLQAVLDNAPIGIWMLNGAGRMVFVNRAFCRSVGIPEERFVSVQHYSEVLDPASAAICMASDHAAMAQDTPHVSHENVLFVDGQYHDLEVVKVRLSSPDGEPAGLVGLSADVTARMRTEEQLKESEARYRGLIENLSAAVLVYNRDRTVELCNPAAATLLGMAREQLAGKAAMDPGWRFLRENGTALPEDEYPVNRVFATGTAIRNQVYSMVRGEGRDPVWTLCNAHPVFDKAGALSQVVVSFTDITEHKLAEQRLLQAQKMESVGRLAGGVAHDFSNILTVINGYSQLLLHKLDAADPLRPGLEEIALSGERAASLTRQLLAFSRRQDMQPRVFSLNDLLGGMRPMLVRLVGEDVDVRIRPGEGECAIDADPHQIEQVVMNLVVNARDAMPGGGELTIEISSVDLGASAGNRPADAPPGHYILLSVIDNGVGMDEATRSHIFEPFFTLKETGKGTGLGLSTAQGIVAQSGGFIEVQSEIGRGSAFRVFLPRADAPVAQPCEVRSVMDLGGRETVLLVEDQPEVLRFAAQALAEFGYRTLSAGGPEEALATFRRERGRIDLVVTDVVMPGMSGPRLAGALEELCPNVKVLFISGFTGDEIARHGVMDEGVRFLAKPFTPEQLAAKVRAALDAQNS